MGGTVININDGISFMFNGYNDKLSEVVEELLKVAKNLKVIFK